MFSLNYNIQNAKIKSKKLLSRKVLVIDDEELILEVVKGCLEDIAGWQVLTANSGKDGLLSAVVEKPDAIVLDMMMPEMDGLSFLRAFHSRSDDQSIPVILLTAKIGFTDPQSLTKLGVVGIILKPFNPVLLADQIAQHLHWNYEE